MSAAKDYVERLTPLQQERIEREFGSDVEGLSLQYQIDPISCGFSSYSAYAEYMEDCDEW